MNDDDDKLNPSSYSGIINQIGADAGQAAKVLPDATFTGFSTYTLLMAQVCEEIHFLLPQNASTGNAWNIIDAACSVVVGVSQLMSRSANPTVTKAKGVANVGSGTQLGLMTLFGLGNIGFAIGVGIGFTQAIHDVSNTYRRINDHEFWYEDTKNTLGFLRNEARIISHDIGIINNELLIDSSHVKKLNWVNERKNIRIFKIEAEIAKLEGYIRLYDVHISSQSTDNNKTLPPEILKQLSDEMRGNIQNLLICGTAFVGMVLLCFPLLQIPALAFIAVAVGLYMYKHHDEISSLFLATKEGLSAELEISVIKDMDDNQEGDENSVLLNNGPR
jgi:hypothetical protein